jgi:hypothetical protein
MKLKITCTPEEIARLWDIARAGTDTPDNDFAEGAYAMIQALTGGGSIEEVEDGCRND